jgi:NAD-dependent dihydropyrimidine dehydrogenase PreA subunit
MTIFYFTSTGNSLAVAKAIGGKQVSIPQVVESADLRFEDDVIGLVFPIYGFGLPKMVRRFIENAAWKADYAFAVGTYGNMAGAAMYNVQRLAEERGKRFDYAESLLMVDNFLPMFDISRQAEMLSQKKTDENLARIVAEIAERKKLQAKASLPLRMLAAVIGAANQSVMNGSNGRQFKIDDNCSRCGVCASVCPCGNISVADKTSFGGNCEFCLACVHHCPKNAIHVKGEKSGVRWRHPSVTLNEIVSANKRDFE